jgi:hypothetical protein
VLDDEVEFRQLLEVMLDALRAIFGAILDDRLPALVGMQGNNVAHSEIPQDDCRIAIGAALLQSKQRMKEYRRNDTETETVDEDDAGEAA